MDLSAYGVDLNGAINSALDKVGGNLPSGVKDALKGTANSVGNIVENMVNNIDVNNIDVNKAQETSDALLDYANKAKEALSDPNGLNTDNLNNLLSTFGNYTELANSFLQSIGIDFNQWLPKITTLMTTVVAPLWENALGSIYEKVASSFNINQFGSSVDNLFSEFKTDSNLKSEFTSLKVADALSESNRVDQADLITGTSKANKLFGAGGNDLIDGASGNDSLNGGSGNDKITAGTGNDFVDGGAGNDILKGDNGNDSINGGNGDDLLSGGKGNDVLKGDAGMDIIDGGAGSDKLYGGDGKDIFIFAEGNNTDTIFDFNAKNDMISINFDIDMTDESSDLNELFKVSQVNNAKDTKITYIKTGDALILKNLTTDKSMDSMSKLIALLGEDNIILPTVVEKSNAEPQEFNQQSITEDIAIIVGTSSDFDYQ